MELAAIQSIAIVTGVAVCAISELSQTPAGVPDRVCPLVPGAIAWDDCQCGQFAQTIVNSFPSEVFPSPQTLSDARCGAKFLVVNALASITRCVPSPTDGGHSPKCSALFNAAIQLEADRIALYKGIRCCLRGYYDTYRIFNFIIGTANTVGPEGQCAGVEIPYQFALGGICCD